VIDFWGAGFDIANRMGLMPELRREGYMVDEVRAVNRSGKRVAGFPAAAFGRMTGGNYISLPRGDLSASLHDAIANRVETIFGDSVAGVRQTDRAVHVAFEHGREREFDLAIGADGLHSCVRELVFGEESRFEKYLGFKAAAFEAAGYRPRDELAYVMYTQPHRQVARFALRGDRTMFLFTFSDEDASLALGPAGAKAQLRALFGKSGWECPHMLDALDGCSDLYFDRMSQIRMGEGPGSWSRGRVTLVGDSASCISLLGGQGSALAMVAGYILAGELHKADGDHVRAFARYEELFAPFAREKQKVALRFAGFFAPRSNAALFLRNRVMSLLEIPWVADLAVGKELTDRIAIPEY
jgi:2-polyprenyl-6-methoxyphenol hydroxylase-like FAD-dependent oxidoreductase